MTLQTQNGVLFEIDDADHELIRPYRWYAYAPQGENYTKYVVTGGPPRIYLHRLILAAPKGSSVDHVDSNGLNNKRANLRLCTHSQNLQNRRGPTRVSTTGMRNVYQQKGCKTFVVRLNFKGRMHWFGTFRTLNDAAKAARAARASLFTHSED